MWSDELKERTIRHFRLIPIAFVKNDQGHGTGFCRFAEERYNITSYEDRSIIFLYDTIEELLEDGWVIN